MEKEDIGGIFIAGGDPPHFTLLLSMRSGSVVAAYTSYTYGIIPENSFVRAAAACQALNSL